MKKIEEKLKKILTKKIKPLTGNHRSFSNRASKRKFQGNKQKFKIGNKIYKLTVRDFRSLKGC